MSNKTITRICKKCHKRQKTAEFSNMGQKCQTCKEKASVLFKQGFKICTRCHKKKQLCDFNAYERAEDGKYTVCKQCIKSAKKSKEYNEERY